MTTFAIPTTLHIGSGSLEHLRTIPAARVLLVTDPVMAATDIVTRAISYLGAARVSVFSEVEPNPSVRVVAAATRELLAIRPDLILAVGGGSSIDTAKAVLRIAQDNDLPVSNGLVAVPTTSGSGSEVTSFAVITEEADHQKVALTSPRMTPRMAILDAECTRSAPARVTADAGMDAMTHAVEAYISTTHNDFSDALAEKAIQLACSNLQICFHTPDNLDARQHMHNASCLAALAFQNAGLGITHSLAHAIGGRFPVAHGRLNAMLMPHTLAWNAASPTDPTIKSRLAWLGHLTGAPARGEHQQFTYFVSALRQLHLDLGIRPHLSNHGVDPQAFRESIPSMAEAALQDTCTPTNPRTPTQADLERILHAIA